MLLTATSREDKLWPEERWIALGREFQMRGLRCLLPAGSASERERALLKQWPGAVRADILDGKWAPPVSDGSGRDRENARKALAPGGVLAIWSAERDDKFVRRMESVGFTIDEVGVRARYDASGKGKGPRHVIWFATENT